MEIGRQRATDGKRRGARQSTNGVGIDDDGGAVDDATDLRACGDGHRVVGR